MTSKIPEKIDCLNPHTGRKMKIDGVFYRQFDNAIRHALKKSKIPARYTDIVRGVKEYFKERKIIFKGSIEWYTVTVKNDLEARGIIETFFDKGRKFHRLKK